MPAEVVPGEFCASWFADYKVRSSDGKRDYFVSLGGSAFVRCSCTGFRFHQHCKHVDKVMKEACLWNCQWHEGNDPVKIRPKSILYDGIVSGTSCRNCGGPLVAVKIAV